MKYLSRVLIGLIIIMNFTSYYCYAVDDFNTELEKQKNVLDLSAFSNEVKKYGNDALGELNPDKLITDIATGKFSFDTGGFFKKVMGYFVNEFRANLKIMINIVIISVICAIFKNMQDSFGSDGVQEISFYASYVLIVTLIIASYVTVINLGKDTITNLINFMQSIIPMLITLLASSGNITASGIIHPVIIFFVEVGGNIMINIIIPLIFISAVLGIITNISEKVQITKLNNFIKSSSVWIIGILLTVFVGIVSLEGTMASSIDGITAKTAKYAISNGVPVVGKILGDVIDSVMGCSLVLKNAVGVMGALVIFTICMFPILKITVIMLIYMLTAAAIQPISDSRIVKCLNEVSSSMKMILGSVISIAFMFVIGITSIVKIANMTAMFR